jgi:hypothetical protein
VEATRLSYFSAHNKQVLGLEIPNSDSFARHYMKLFWYKQIRAAFHPEDRHDINTTFNQASRNANYMGENRTFDEGGLGSLNQMNLVRQYNKDKPQKFRVDFLIVACSGTYYIHHMDVYQGKNASNIGVD